MQGGLHCPTKHFPGSTCKVDHCHHTAMTRTSSHSLRTHLCNTLCSVAHFPSHMREMFVYDQSAGRQMLACSVYTVLFFLLVAVCSVRTCCHIIAGCLNYLVKICVTMECVLLFCTDGEKTIAAPLHVVL